MAKRTGVIEDILGLGRKEEAKTADKHDARRFQLQQEYNKERREKKISLIEYAIKTFANK